MAHYFVLLIAIFLCHEGCKATSGCEQKIAVEYLDSAVNMIAKAKSNIKKSTDCDENITRRAKDCSEILQMGSSKSGIYTIWPASRVIGGKSIEVFCDMKTTGGGWTVIQRRGNFQRAVDYFYKDWKSYKAGFGDIEKDFWLGNDNIFALSNQNLYSVRFDLRDAENSSKYAQYDTFWIDDEDHQYTLHIADYTGDAGDPMIVHNNQKFSTKDRENDNQKVENCAQLYKGGWWYNACHSANPNGLYLKGKHVSFADGVIWKPWRGYHVSMEWTEIKIRPQKFKLPPVSSNIPM